MTGRESTEPLDPAQIMVAHPNGSTRLHGEFPWCVPCKTEWPCLPYRLAEALAAEQARGTALLERLDAIQWNRFTGEISADDVITALEPFRAALAGDTERAKS